MTVKNPFWPASHARVAGEPGVNQHANRKIVPMKTSKNAALALIATAVAAAAIVLPAAADADPTPACGDGQVVATAGLSEGGAGHRGLILIFSLAPGAGPCTLTGYRGVDSGAGGPLIHAERTLSGYLGGLRTQTPPTVTPLPSQPAQAVVEGAAVDPRDWERLCPTYTDFRVTPPDTTQTFTVPAMMDICELQIHPVGSDM
jgi:Protein of unknown function (DUF4232)